LLTKHSRIRRSLKEDLGTLNLTTEEFVAFLGRCAPTTFSAWGHDFDAIVKKGDLSAEGVLPSGGTPLFEYEEHHMLGDALELPGWDTADSTGKDKSAKINPLTLPNKLQLSYGQINALAGDFYGTWQPIATGKDLQEQMTFFEAAFNTLARGPREKVDALLKILQRETNAVQEAKQADPPKSVKQVYDEIGTSMLVDLIKASKIGSTGPSYSDLLENNIDHFAPDSVTAYNAGHAKALETAANAKSEQDLSLAYAMNAFADHFLEDHFASGHLRVPRAFMMDIMPKNICTNFMHNEDNTNGLNVLDSNKKAWHCYGDEMLLDPSGRDTMQQCLNALRQSVQEVWDAYKNGKNKKVIGPKEFKAWQFAPVASTAGNIAPMFKIGPKNEILQRTGLDRLKDDPYNWKDYESVVGSKFTWLNTKKTDVNAYVYWSLLAYKRAPNNYYRNIIREKLNEKMKDWHFPQLAIDLVNSMIG